MTRAQAQLETYVVSEDETGRHYLDADVARQAINKAEQMAQGKWVNRKQLESSVEQALENQRKTYNDTIQQLETANADIKHRQQFIEKAYRDLLVEQAFIHSDFIRNETRLTPTVARSIFGQHFEMEVHEDSFRLIAKQSNASGEPVLIVNTMKPSQPATPEQTIKVLFEDWSERDYYRKMNTTDENHSLINLEEPKDTSKETTSSIAKYRAYLKVS